MDTAKKIEDTRPTVAGFALPWRVTVATNGDEVLDADGDEIVSFDEDVDGGFWRGLTDDVNAASDRIAALEAALWDMACLYSAVTEEEEYDAANDLRCNDIIDRFPGLAERVNGNLVNAEAVSS